MTHGIAVTEIIDGWQIVSLRMIPGGYKARLLGVKEMTGFKEKKFRKKIIRKYKKCIVSIETKEDATHTIFYFNIEVKNKIDIMAIAIMINMIFEGVKK